MAISQEVKIDLVLLAQKYKQGLTQVDGSTTASGKVAERVFMRMEKDAQQAAAMYGVLGDDTRKLSTDQKTLEAAITRLTKAGFSAQSPEVKALVADYKKLHDTSNTVGKGQDTLGQTFAKMRDVMQGPIAAAREIYQVLKQVVAVGSDLYNEYAEAEKGQIVFAQAMKESGQMSESAGSKLKNYAQELQDLTGIDADNTVAMMGNLAVQGKTEKQILDLTEAAANYAAATGKDMNTAITELSSTLTGTTGRLGRTNGAIKALTVEQLKHGDAIKIINDQYKGMAEAVGKSAMGAVDKLKASIGDLKEEQGRAIAYGMKPYLGWLTDIANAATEAAKKVNDMREANDNWVAGTATVEQYKTLIEGYKVNIAKLDLEIKNSSSVVAAGLIAQKEALESTLYDLEKTTKMREGSTKAAKLAAEQQAKADKDAAEAAKLKADEEAYLLAQMELVAEYNRTEMIRAAKAEAEAVLLQADAAALLREQFLQASVAFEALGYGGNGILAPAIDADMAAFEKYLSGLDAIAEKQKAIADTAMSGFKSMSSALGSALVSGEEGWKAFGKAGLNAIAGVIEAMAKSAEVAAGEALVAVLLGDLTKLPALGAAAAQIALAYGAAGAVRAIPMADGGSGTVNKPTLFLAGEAGPEDYAFGPKRKGGLSGGVTQIFNIGGSVVSEREVMQLGVAGMAMASRGY